MLQILIKKYIIVLLLLMVFCFPVMAQADTQPIHGHGIYLSGNVGISKLMGETPYNFSSVIREFDNQPGASFNLELSKFLGKNIETGIGFSLSLLNGEAAGPLAFSATGIHYYMKDLNDEPIIYRNRLLGPEIFIRYYFTSLRNRIAPFMGIGIGNMFYMSKLKYKNKDQLIFGKSVEKFEMNHISSANYFVQPGIRTSLFRNIDINASLKFNFVNYDFLDVVHNYDSDGTRRQLIGIYSEWQVGISIKIGESSFPFKETGQQKGTSKYFPFYFQKK